MYAVPDAHTWYKLAGGSRCPAHPQHLVFLQCYLSAFLPKTEHALPKSCPPEPAQAHHLLQLPWLEKKISSTKLLGLGYKGK